MKRVYQWIAMAALPMVAMPWVAMERRVQQR